MGWGGQHYGCLCSIIFLEILCLLLLVVHKGAGVESLTNGGQKNKSLQI